VWDRSCWHGRSWQRLNTSMSAAVRLAIEGGLSFDVDDFEAIARPLRMAYWCGADSGEDWYRLAIETGHPTAIAAYERWRDRKPYLVRVKPREKTKLRLHLGARFCWHVDLKASVFVMVTSFAKDQSFLTACSYNERPQLKRCKTCDFEPCEFARDKIDKRFKITHAAIREYHAAFHLP